MERTSKLTAPGDAACSAFQFSQSEANKLANLGLPLEVQLKYECRGISRLFPWQIECLSSEGVLDDQLRNLVYSAPTSAGKTLIAEIIAIKTVLERSKKVLFILPFVSVVREKIYFFQDIFGGSGIRVDGFMGSYNPPGGFKSVEVAICTIERANSLVNRLLEGGRLKEIGAVIVDELHMLGDPGRGYLLELLLTKLRYISLKDKQLAIQIVGMSATLPNLDVLGRWLDSALYVTTFRPIPLNEQYILNGELFDRSSSLLRTLAPIGELERDPDNILQLCLEPVVQGCSVLVFCPAKNWCETLAGQVSAVFYTLGTNKGPLGMALRAQLNPQTIVECLEQLRRSPSGLDGVLQRTVSFGVAFHHAGLTMDERDIIEGAFRSGVIKVLVATSTLSSGVNLPARRVIIRTPMFFGRPIDILAYKQMAGRAGRMGKDTSGESILVCKRNELTVAQQLIAGELDPIRSCLENSGRLNRALLEVIASGVASSPAEVETYAACTLLHHQADEEQPLDAAVEYLAQNEFIRLQVTDAGEQRFVATPLAKACLNSSMPPEEATALLVELERARQCLVLDTDLHLIYLVTPMNMSLANIDWMHFLEVWEALSGSMRRVGEMVGVKLSYIINCTRGKTSSSSAKQAIHSRFYTALALQELVNEVPLGDVALKFGCNRGALQSLQQSAATYAGRVTTFAKQLGWSSMELLLGQFQDRLQFGVSRDLLDLMKLPVLNAQRARVLYNVGVETLVDLAACDALDLENVLHRAMPFESKERKEGETDGDAQRRLKLRTVFITGMQGMTELEAARMMIRDAQKYLQYEIGVNHAQWEKAPDENEVAASQRQSEVEEREKMQSQVETPKDDGNLEAKSDSIWDSIASLSVGEWDPKISETVADMESLRMDDPKQQDNSTESLFNDSFEGQLKDISFSEEKPDLGNDSYLVKAFVDSFNPPDTNPKMEANLDGSLANEFSESFDLPTAEVNTESGSGGLSFKEEGDSFFANFLNKSSTTTHSQGTDVPKIPINSSQSNCFEIIRVTDHQDLYKAFLEDLKKQNAVGMALAFDEHEEKHIIGLCQRVRHRDKLVWEHLKLVAIAFYWPGPEVAKPTCYYMDVHSERFQSSDLGNILSSSKISLRVFNAKEQMKHMSRILEWSVDNIRFEDPMLADWILDPDVGEKDICQMLRETAPHLEHLLAVIEVDSKGASLGLSSRVESKTSAKLRSCLEALISWNLMNSLIYQINQQDGVSMQYFDSEMGVLQIVAKMELTGMPVDVILLQSIADDLKACTQAIETEAFNIAGRRFSFLSGSAVARVLQLRAKPPNGSRKSATNKAALVQYASPLAELILQWRRFNSALTKVAYPILRRARSSRIHGVCLMHNATGRITMHEPSLQNVPRDLEFVDPVTRTARLISLRSAFALPSGSSSVLVAADYCQLELRILAHMSSEPTLCRIMRQEGDIFTSIAAEWQRIDETRVDATLRQQTKQICYGIIYGIGAKSLSEQMSVTEDEAAAFIAAFHDKFPGIREFITNVVQNCKRGEFVETILGRRRFLPRINSSDAAERSKAERQAVNTMIQGSAADIVKRAMGMLDATIQDKFRKSRNAPALVLQLHDELLFEVPQKYEVVFAKLLRKCMQKAVLLSVPLPVKVEKGNCWGKLALISGN